MSPRCHTRIITDNGPQFLTKDFKEFIRLSGMIHVKTSPYYPQSNCKIERFHRTLKHDAGRQLTPLSRADADRVVGHFVTHYNAERLHCALGFVTPHDVLAGRKPAIHAARDQSGKTPANADNSPAGLRPAACRLLRTNPVLHCPQS